MNIDKLLHLIRDYGGFDEAVFAKLDSYLREQLARLENVKEAGKNHADESTLTHTLQVVDAIHALLSSLKEQSDKLEFVEQLYKLIDKEKIHKHLQSKVGNYTRETLLFFATLFHDIGKLGHFVTTEKSLVELNKFSKHAWLGGHFVNFSQEGLDAIDTELNRIKEELKQLKGQESLSKKEKKKFEELRQLKVQLWLARREIKKNKDLLESLGFDERDREYLVFVISNHMKCYESFQMLSQISPNDKKFGKKVTKLKERILGLINDFGDYYYDLMLFFVSDKLGTGGFFHKLPPEVLRYVEIVNRLFENPQASLEEFFSQ